VSPRSKRRAIVSTARLAARGRRRAGKRASSSRFPRLSHALKTRVPNGSCASRWRCAESWCGRAGRIPRFEQPSVASQCLLISKP
jgi:hypothetical protein